MVRPPDCRSDCWPVVHTRPGRKRCHCAARAIRNEHDAFHGPGLPAATRQTGVPRAGGISRAAPIARGGQELTLSVAAAEDNNGQTPRLKCEVLANGRSSSWSFSLARLIVQDLAAACRADGAPALVEPHGVPLRTAVVRKGRSADLNASDRRLSVPCRDGLRARRRGRSIRNGSSVRGRRQRPGRRALRGSGRAPSGAKLAVVNECHWLIARGGADDWDAGFRAKASIVGMSRC
jgi:hypothetical protein